MTDDVLDAPEPHEIPPRSIIGQALVGVTFYDRVRIQGSDADVLAAQVLDVLSAAGYVVVKAEGLRHGDELVRIHPWQDWFALRRSVRPEPESEA